MGVPVGYILHQIYFGLSWVVSKKRKYADDFANKLGDKLPKQNNWGTNKNEDYYQIDYVWHAMLLNQDVDTRTYLEGRYRYMLGTIHSIGALFFSSLISLLISGFFGFTLLNKESMFLYYIVGVVFQFAIFLAAMVNYCYYSLNLKAFQIKFLKKYP